MQNLNHIHILSHWMIWFSFTSIVNLSLSESELESTNLKKAKKVIIQMFLNNLPYLVKIQYFYYGRRWNFTSWFVFIALHVDLGSNCWTLTPYPLHWFQSHVYGYKYVPLTTTHPTYLLWLPTIFDVYICVYCISKIQNHSALSIYSFNSK